MLTILVSCDRYNKELCHDMHVHSTNIWKCQFQQTMWYYSGKASVEIVKTYTERILINFSTAWKFMRFGQSERKRKVLRYHVDNQKP